MCQPHDPLVSLNAPGFQNAERVNAIGNIWPNVSLFAPTEDKENIHFRGVQTKRQVFFRTPCCVLLSFWTGRSGSRSAESSVLVVGEPVLPNLK